MLKVLSLGAGVQSTTVFLMSCLGQLERLDCAIFADTQWEPEAVYNHLLWLESKAQEFRIPIYRVSKGNLRADALQSKVRAIEGSRAASMPLYTKQADGSIGMIRRQCTKEYKIDVVEKKIRSLLSLKRFQRAKPGSVEIWFGISSDEMRRVRMSDKLWKSHRYPLIFDKPTSRVGCLQWLKTNGFPEPPRSACIGCPFHSNHEWRQLKNNPKEWADAVEFDEAIRNSGGARGDVYLHRSGVPLKYVDLRTDAEKGQGEFWDNECMGVCGV